ncbi:MAG: hypothetical protein Q4G13_01640 [Moraxella sp.]|nr:hypothetical protein [Moraxella sp.]
MASLNTSISGIKERLSLVSNLAPNLLQNLALSPALLYQNSCA